MILVEQATVPAAALPVAEFRDYLRLGTGFADAAEQDGVLETCLRGAIAAIEARTGKAVLRRAFQWSVTAWRDLSRQVLPVAPVAAITRLAIVERSGTEAEIAPSRYALERDTHRPALVAQGFLLPSIPLGGSAEITFEAGYGAAWTGVPADLRKAVFALAASYYENRHGATDGAEGFPAEVNALLVPHLNLRLFGGGRR
ncbi:head-tail connector protein [Palleronia sp. KMU-117]|uniref:head-tail connector protein n=1 Tax=Palleronia sp. KMU-117 TaxID=3434108 RepID=UPI003D741649